MEIRDLLAVVLKRRFVVLSVLLVAVGLAAVLAFNRPAHYESTATIALTPDIKSTVGLVNADTLSSLLGTYAETARSTSNQRNAARLLGRPLPGEIRTSFEAGTGILRITGRATTPQAAVVTAYAAANAFRQSIADNKLLTTEIVDPPQPSSVPVQPRPPLIIAVAALLGLIGGLLLALALEHLRRRVETSADVAELTSAPVIGHLPRQRALQRQPARLVWDSDKLAGMQEAFRALRTNVEFLLDDLDHAVIQVTSADESQGKSTVVANLGVALAQIGIRTTIVDADLRRPRQHLIFRLPNDEGLSTLMAVRNATVAPLPTAVPNLSVVPSGPLPPAATELLHIRFRSIVDAMRARDEFVLVDSPPLLPVSDARLIAATVDRVLLVVSAGSERPARLASAVEKLTFSGATLAGIILNGSGSDFETGSGYGYGYRAEEPARPDRPLELT